MLAPHRLQRKVCRCRRRPSSCRRPEAKSSRRGQASWESQRWFSSSTEKVAARPGDSQPAVSRRPSNPLAKPQNRLLAPKSQACGRETVSGKLKLWAFAGEPVGSGNPPTLFASFCCHVDPFSFVLPGESLETESQTSDVVQGRLAVELHAEFRPAACNMVYIRVHIPQISTIRLGVQDV